MILGLSAHHADASAVIVVDGAVVAAVEEERFTRVKHASGLPVESVRWVMGAAGLEARDIEHIAISRDPHAHRARRALGGVRQSIAARRLPAAHLRSRADVLNIVDDLAGALDVSFAAARTHHVEHHLAHQASAFYPSGFDEAALCSVDGMGDFSSMSWGIGRGTRLHRSGNVLFPHSLGFFYTAITQLLGFEHFGDEYKVMGLAPYGVPRFLQEMRDVVSAKGRGFRLNKRYFRPGREQMTWSFDGGAPEFEHLFTPALEELLFPRRRAGDPLEDRHRDLAASAQARLEEVLLPMLDRLQRATGLRSLAMAGGVALNVTANTKITRDTAFEDVFIQPAAGDAGTSIGAALCVAHDRLGAPRNYRMTHAYLGPSFSSDECERSLRDAALDYERLDEQSLCERTAELVSQSKIVGWFQGRMEFGPRALGNRSIVCDPRNPEMKDIVNQRTKRRESFRPFAPSVLVERVEDVYEHCGPSPFMLFAPAVRAEWRERIPAVTHVDGTGRIQTVDSETNPRYWRLLRAFEDRTGVPVVLNTSFNENEPIVCTPGQAIACFLRADMDVLALENFLVTRRS